MVDINIELFKRYSPLRKKDIINNLTDEELLSLKEKSVLKIIKEVGFKRNKNDKRLMIDLKRRAGNDWNSVVQAVEYFKVSSCHNCHLFLNVYVQMDSTDTDEIVTWTEFFKKGEFRGTCYEMNRYGDSVPHYYRYSNEEKAKVVKSILLEYIYTKYKDKL